MSNDKYTEIEARFEFDKMKASQQDLEEFKKLGSTEFGIKYYLYLLGPMLLLIFGSNYLELEGKLKEIIYYILIATAMVQGIISQQTQKINRRIDLLFKMLKQEKKQS